MFCVRVGGAGPQTWSVSHGSHWGTGMYRVQARQVRAGDGRGLTYAVDRPALCQPF